MARVFISGANGFIGQTLGARLVAEGHEVLGGIRKTHPLPAGITPLITGDLTSKAPVLDGVDVVIHAAGLAHQKGYAPEDLMRANVSASENLACATPEHARFIFLSSIVVHGRSNATTITERTPPTPADIYAQSKLVAEQALASQLGSRLCVVRPTAVIGPRCPGNIPLLIKALQKGLPLPLGAIDNARSFIDIEDLASLIALLVVETAPELVLAAHPTPISTPDLIRALAKGLNHPARLLPIPPSWLSLAARAVGKSQMWQSLSGNLAVRPEAALKLGWQPATSLAASFEKTGMWAKNNA